MASEIDCLALVIPVWIVLNINIIVVHVVFPFKDSNLSPTYHIKNEHKLTFHCIQLNVLGDQTWNMQ